MKTLTKLTIALFMAATLLACGSSPAKPDVAPDMAKKESEMKNEDGAKKKSLKKFDGGRMEGLSEEDE